MISPKWFKIVVKIALFAILLILFCHFYMVDQLTDYFRHRTTMTSRFETKDSFEPPLITICTEPVFKQSVGKKFGFWYNFHVFEKQVPNLTFPQAYSSLSYILNKDYKVKLKDKDMSKGQYLVVGNNQVGSNTFIVQSIQTGYHGTCLNIQPNFTVTPSNGLT